MTGIRRRLAPALAAAAVLALPASAPAAADIEGVWSFNGGQVAVEAQSDGSFRGTVIRATRLSTCAHPVGERMWTNVRAQPDGSYWGEHRYFNTGGCTVIAEPGQAAYRVLRRANGSRFLRVCFAKPENPAMQPKIAPDGTATDEDDGCNDSDAVAPPSKAPTVTSITNLPATKRCRSRRTFRIRLREPRGDALDTARVYVNGRRVALRRRDRITAPVDLRGLPRGRYTVRIVAKTVLGRTISGERRYRTCAPKRR